MIYEHRGRLEAGIDGLIELRDPSTGAVSVEAAEKAVGDLQNGGGFTPSPRTKRATGGRRTRRSRTSARPSG